MWGGKSEYLFSFFASAVAAAAPASKLVACRCEWANVSGHVASHARHLPFFHGMDVMPSGRLAFPKQSPRGSRVDNMFALENARYRISLI